MTHRGPFQPWTFCDSVILWYLADGVCRWQKRLGSAKVLQYNLICLVKWRNLKACVVIIPHVICMWEHRNAHSIRDSVLRSCDSFLHVFCNQLHFSTQCSHRVKSTSKAPGETNRQLWEETIAPSSAWAEECVQLHTESCCPWLCRVLWKQNRCHRGTKKKIREVENVLFSCKTEVLVHTAYKTEGLKGLNKF